MFFRIQKEMPVYITDALFSTTKYVHEHNKQEELVENYTTYLGKK